MIQPSGGSVQSGHSGYHPQQQQQYNQYQQQQQPQQQYYNQYNNTGHGYVVGADGQVQNVSTGVTGVSGVQISGYSHGVQYNPGGRSSGQGLSSGALNAGYHGSMDSLNSNTLSYDSDLSAG